MLRQSCESITIVPDELEWLYVPDVVYLEDKGIKRCMQMIIPYKQSWREEEKFPLIIFIPGSAWHRQEMYNNIPARAKLAKKGFIIAEVQYRESELAVFPAQVIDVKRAISFIFSIASQFHIDTDNIFLAGDSSGRHIALLTGLMDDVKNLEDENSNTIYHINGIISYYAPTDMFLTKKEGPMEDLLGVNDVKDAPELARNASCKTYISAEKKIPPILMFHGKKDEVVSIKHSRDLFDILKECDKEVEYYEIEESGHGGAAYWTDEILDIVEKFVKRNCN